MSNLRFYPQERIALFIDGSNLYATARALGVTAPLLAVPSSVLGANDVSPLDMTSAYATIANEGVHHPPVFVTRVLDASGAVIWEHDPQPRRAIEKSTAEEELVAAGRRAGLTLTEAARAVANGLTTGEGDEPWDWEY